MPRIGMPSIRYLYRIGRGPSSSHTMAPEHAALMFRIRTPKAVSYKVTLYGSLASTGIGHMTHSAIINALGPDRTRIISGASSKRPKFPVMMRFEALDNDGSVTESWRVASKGGGTLCDMKGHVIGDEADPVYQLTTMASILEHVKKNGIPLWKYVADREGSEIWDYLKIVWQTMQSTIDKGLNARGLLPGPLKIERKAHHYYREAVRNDYNEYKKCQDLLFAYALACSEENASGGMVVTAPTCGASGVVPALAKQFNFNRGTSETKIIYGLATAALVGNLAKYNASILGAEVGCQGEVGVACAMAAAMATQFLGGTPDQIEYAAQMAIKHHLGLTCVPKMGLVQEPCIERNTHAAAEALSVATFAISSEGEHVESYDNELQKMLMTGHDMKDKYKETSRG